MITGDNPLTACHVARELRFARKPFTLVLTKREDVDGSSNVCPWTWLSVDEMRRVDLVPKNVDKDLLLNYDLCVTGEVGSSYHSCTLQAFFPRCALSGHVETEEKLMKSKAKLVPLDMSQLSSSENLDHHCQEMNR
jgi:magnesium-transporting ATPase (P-type)